MVFVWSNLTKGEPHFTLSQVALNDLIMVFAFAPIVGLLLGLSAITVPWDTLVLSVALYIVIPVIASPSLAALGVDRRRRGGARTACSARLQPVSLVALLATLVLLFGFQGGQILAQPLIIALLAVPILIQVYFNAGLAYLLNRYAGEQHCVAGPSALIGASNFFELAVAAAISLFGFQSGAALATVVGVLIEVPVMLSVVYIVNASQGWYERGLASEAQTRRRRRKASALADLRELPNIAPAAFEIPDSALLHVQASEPQPAHPFALRLAAATLLQPIFNAGSGAPFGEFWRARRASSIRAACRCRTMRPRITPRCRNCARFRPGRRGRSGARPSDTAQ